MADLGEQTWRRVRAAIDGYAGDMLHFIANCYGVDAMQQGWFEFTTGTSEEFVQGDPNAELFFSWLFHVWSPERRKGNAISDEALSGVAMIEALAPYSFPPSYKTHLIQVRSRPELKHPSDLALRTVYFALADAYLNPALPKLHNTDGEPIEPRTLYFEIDSAQAAFDALSCLALGSIREELQAEAKFNAKGAVIEAQISWIRRNPPKHDLETVVLGQLHIADRKLKVEVNSAARASAFRKQLEKTPGLKARYLRTRKHPVDVTGAARLPGAGAGFTPRSAEQEELLRQPEVRAKLEQLQRRHYENWPEVALPGLNNKTPLEAVRDCDGREMVEALITQFVRDAPGCPSRRTRQCSRSCVVDWVCIEALRARCVSHEPPISAITPAAG